ncbi:hypothetical protein WJX79_004243 [Trebouxia sp. C0005]
MDTDMSTDAINDLVEQYEYECLLSSRNGGDMRAKVPPGITKSSSVCFSPDLTHPDTSVLLIAKTAPPMQLSTKSLSSSTPLPELYSANHTVSKLTKTSSLIPPVDWVRDMPVRAKSSLLADVWGDHERPYNGSERARVQRLGRPPSSKGAILQASTWFDDVAAPRMQQMHKVQKDVVRGHDQELEGKVQQLTESLCQDMQSLKSIGTDIPVRLAVDRISLYVAEIMPMINECRAEVLDVQTQYTDGVEDFVKAVFVRGIEDAIAARDAWHLDKMKAMQAAADADGQPQRAEPIGRAPTSLQPVSSAAENLTGIEYANMTMTHSSNDQNMPLEQIMPAEPFFTNTQQQVAVQRVAQRRVGIRGATPSPILAAHRTDSLSHTQSTALGQTVTRGAAAGSPSPVFTASKLQAALQKTLGQLPKG